MLAVACCLHVENGIECETRLLWFLRWRWRGAVSAELSRRLIRRLIRCLTSCTPVAARSRFTADISEADTDNVMGKHTTKTGKVWYQLKPNGDVRMHVLFDKKQVGEKPAYMCKRREYLLDNGWIIDRDYAGKVETNRQVSRPGEKVNLFQLGKGVAATADRSGQEDVHEQFDVTLVPPAKDDPAGTVHLQLKPKSGTESCAEIHHSRFLDRSEAGNARSHRDARCESIDRSGDRPAKFTSESDAGTGGWGFCCRQSRRRRVLGLA